MEPRSIELGSPMDDQLIYAKMKTFDDFVRFVGMSPTPFVQYVEIEGKHVYFVALLGFGGGKMVYYFEREKKIDEKYIIFNRFRDQVAFSNNFSSDGQSTYIPILELEKTNVFSEYPPK